jgi:protein-disulfide isomerase
LVRPGRVAITFRPLAFIGADSERAAAMAGALAAQGRAWQFIELMYRNQGLENSGYVTPTYLAALASAIPGVRLTRALRERQSPGARSALTQATALARALHIQSTPSFLIARSGQAPRHFSPASLVEAEAFTGPLERVLAGGSP